MAVPHTERQRGRTGERKGVKRFQQHFGFGVFTAFSTFFYVLVSVGTYFSTLSSVWEGWNGALCNFLVASNTVP